MRHLSIKTGEKRTTHPGLRPVVRNRHGMVIAGNLNPKGRPRKEHTFSDIARELLSSQAICLKYQIDSQQKEISLTTEGNFYHSIIATLILKALDGNISAIRELIDRTEGKAKEIFNQDQNLNVTWQPLSRVVPIEAESSP